MRFYLIICFVGCLFIHQTFAQTISGSSTGVTQNTYQYSLAGTYNNPGWTVSGGGTIISQGGGTCMEGSHCASISWSTSGSKTVKFYNLGVLIATKTITISSPSGNTVSGPNEVNLGTSSTYSLNSGQTYFKPKWEGVVGTFVSKSVSGTNYSGVILWNVAGQQRVDLNYFEGGTIATKQVTVLPQTPSVTFGITGGCDQAVLKRNQEPPSSVQYYWQTSPTGTSTSLGYADSLVVTTSDTLFLRAASLSTPRVWSNSTQSIVVSVTPETVAGSISVSNSELCGDGTIELSISGHTGTLDQWKYRYHVGDGIWGNWIVFQETDDVTSLDLTLTSALGTTRTYQISAEVQNQNCATLEATQEVIVYPDPTPVGLSAGDTWQVYEGSGSLSLSGTGEAPTGGTWSGTYVEGSFFNTNLSEPGEYEVSYIHSDALSGCQVEATKMVSVLAAPLIVLSNGNSIGLGQSTTLSVTALPNHGYQWKKNGSTIPGANGSALQVSVPGSYSLSITLPNLSTLSTLNVTIADTGLNQNNNFVRTRFFRVPTENEDVSNENIISESFSYFDGLGRPSQSVATKNSPTFQDVVLHIDYDSLGRQTKNFLPYSKTSTAPGTFRLDGSIEQHEYEAYSGQIAYSETKFEASPLNRVLEQAAPGNAWKLEPNGTGKTVKFAYEINTSVDEVRLWKIQNVNGEDQPTSTDFYMEGQLYKSTTTDEDNNQSIAFTNALGQTILKRVMVEIVSSDTTWADTYYVYDIYGQLRTVFPPEATKALEASSWTVTTEILKNWAFTYEYDGRNRMISKQVPGADSVYMVYDKWDRLVLTQDGNQRGSNKWLFTKYDALNRPIITGIYMGGNEATERSNVAGGTYRYEVVNTLIEYGYTNSSYPSITGAELLTITYYDNYEFLNLTGEWTPWEDYDYNNTDELSDSIYGYTYDQDTSENEAVKGLVTGSKTRNLKTGGWIGTVTYYDDKYRVIQTISDNAKGGNDRVTNLYDFVGQVLQSKVVHLDTVGAVPIEVHRRFEYDHGGRLKATYHVVDDETQVLLSYNNYNELSQLTEKNLHASDMAKMQSVDYAYNIRGWLTSINDSDLSSSGDTNEDFFGMELGYDQAISDMSNTGLFNGNISAMKWSDFNENSTNGYAYEYDKLNRLKKAAIGGTDTNAHSVPELNYDLNGNIQNLKRRGDTNSEFIDDLSYTYTGNQLFSVTDAASDTTTFHDKNTSGDDYEYDANGNMIMDKNKGITSIEYNHLNLPEKVVFDSGDSLLYYYDAAGIKLRQEVYKDGEMKTKRDYVGEFYYENDTLKFINHEEGRIVVKQLQYGLALDYQYHLKDHLGNTRLTFSTTNESYTMTATMEAANQSEEEELFQPMTHDQRNGASGFGNDSNYVMRLNTNSSNDGVTMNGIVAMKSMFGVNKGDTLHLSAQAFYQFDPVDDGFFSSADLFMAILVGSEGGTGLGEGASLQASSLNASDIYTTQLSKNGTVDETVPRAYLNYMIFKEDMTYITSGFIQITNAAKNAWETVAFEDPLVIDQNGYVLVYVSNETNAASVVDFDNLEIIHAKTPIVQVDDYYPFGLTFNSFTRSYSESQKYKFNGYEVQEELNTLLSEYRMYDPSIGRFWAIDPKTKENISPYVFANNNPVLFMDYLGLDTLKPQQDQALVNAPPIAPTVLPMKGTGILGALLYFVSGQAAADAMGNNLDGTPKNDGNSDQQTNSSTENEETTDTENDDDVTLYRGVGTGNSGQHKLALVGIAIPLGIDGGHSDPVRHNDGDNWSVFTSWTTKKERAAGFARSDGPGGVVLEKRFKKSEMIPSPDRYREGEVLIPGIVRGATPTVIK